MKKLALSLAVLFSVALVSCGGNKAEATDSAMDSDTVAVEAVEVANESETAVAVEAAEAPAEAPAEAAPAEAAPAQ